MQRPRKAICTHFGLLGDQSSLVLLHITFELLVMSMGLPTRTYVLRMCTYTNVPICTYVCRVGEESEEASRRHSNLLELRKQAAI